VSDRRDRLDADVERLELAMSDCRPGELAALVREHRAVLAELDAMPNTLEVSDADEIAARRASRKSGSSRSPRSKRSG